MVMVSCGVEGVVKVCGVLQMIVTSRMWNDDNGSASGKEEREKMIKTKDMNDFLYVVMVVA